MVLITSISGGDFGITLKTDRFQKQSRCTVQNFILIPSIAMHSASGLQKSLGQVAKDTTYVLHCILWYFVLLFKVPVQGEFIPPH